MALIECPDCGKNVSDAAPQCLSCGRPIASAVAVATSQAPARRPFQGAPSTADAGLACPQCRSEMTRRASVLYAEGTSHTKGLLFGTGGDGMGGGAMSGVQQTQLAALLSPPIPKAPKMTAVLTFAIVAGVVAGTLTIVGVQNTGLMILIAAAAGGIIAYFVYEPMAEYNEYELPKLLHDWENRYLCMRCGFAFLRGPERAR